MSETIVNEYLGMTLQIDHIDHANQTYFQHCTNHQFHLQKCDDCSLIRYPVSEGCSLVR